VRAFAFLCEKTGRGSVMAEAESSEKFKAVQELMHEMVAM
jgi:hypothetical protein